ncbi:ribonuclease HIII [Mycoplasma buteonis]|uniref:ribonuclease HIII n=1 Tax=Mycoplasma buteonis TaxID=171280 RepID=UPI00056984CD|nr:ribonuclease HIII [Mycoplasma buteonis]
MRILDNLENIDLANLQVAGVDETGVGDYFTPLISCAAYLPTNLYDWAISLGVDDSKKLTEKEILKIAPKLINHIPYGIYKLSQSGYNKLSQNYNANELKFFTHQKALNLLINRNNAFQFVIVDRYSTINSINKYYKKIVLEDNWAQLHDLDLAIAFVTKAESINLSVACASIIARYYLIKHMEDQKKEWNFDFPLGASLETQKTVLEFEKLHGKKALNEVCKTNFKLKVKA